MLKKRINPTVDDADITKVCEVCNIIVPNTELDGYIYCNTSESCDIVIDDGGYWLCEACSDKNNDDDDETED